MATSCDAIDWILNWPHIFLRRIYIIQERSLLFYFIYWHSSTIPIIWRIFVWLVSFVIFTDAHLEAASPKQHVITILFHCQSSVILMCLFGDIFWQPVFMSLSISTTMSKFEGPWMFAIASSTFTFVQTLMYIWTGAILVTVQQRERVIFVCLCLRVSSAPAHCASSPDRSGNPSLPAHSEGCFLDQLLC